MSRLVIVEKLKSTELDVGTPTSSHARHPRRTAGRKSTLKAHSRPLEARRDDLKEHVHKLFVGHVDVARTHGHDSAELVKGDRAYGRRQCSETDGNSDENAIRPALGRGSVGLCRARRSYTIRSLRWIEQRPSQLYAVLATTASRGMCRQRSQTSSGECHIVGQVRTHGALPYVYAPEPSASMSLRHASRSASSMLNIPPRLWSFDLISAGVA